MKNSKERLKELDLVAQQIVSSIVSNKLTTRETAFILFSVMLDILRSNENKKIFKEQFGIDIENINGGDLINAVLETQGLLIRFNE